MIIAEEKKMFKTTGTEIFEILYFLFLNIHFGGGGQKHPTFTTLSICLHYTPILSCAA
jgi:hypothetical protein